jgi:signal peptidase I
MNPENQPTEPTETPETAPSGAPQNQEVAETENPIRILFAWLLSWLIVPLALVLFLHFYVFSAYHVVGSSMIQTLHDSDYLIVSKVDHTKAMLGKLTGGSGNYIPGREQIVIFHYPKNPQLDFVKRVIGLPGERVVVSSGQVRVYNKQHPDGFDPNTGYEQEGTYTEGDIDVVVPEGNIFVLGDNRTPNGSSDSREWGFLPSYDIVGNAVLRLYPFDQFTIFNFKAPS